MKKFLLFAIVAVGLSAACAQKTCPTYASNDQNAENIELIDVNNY